MLVQSPFTSAGIYGMFGKDDGDEIIMTGFVHVKITDECHPSLDLLES